MKIKLYSNTIHQLQIKKYLKVLCVINEVWIFHIRIKFKSKMKILLPQVNLELD